MPNIPKISGVYGIRHIPSGKVYVGSAVSITRRWYDHRHRLNKGDHPNRHLQSAWRKYGSATFEFIILERCYEDSQCVVLEQLWIEKLKAAEAEHGYNARPVASSNLGLRMSRLTKLKHSIGYSKKVRISKMPSRKGATQTPEARKKMAAAKCGTRASEETKQKMRASQMARRERERDASGGN